MDGRGDKCAVLNRSIIVRQVTVVKNDNLDQFKVRVILITRVLIIGHIFIIKSIGRAGVVRWVGVFINTPITNNLSFIADKLLDAGGDQCVNSEGHRIPWRQARITPSNRTGVADSWVRSRRWACRNKVQLWR